MFRRILTATAFWIVTLLPAQASTGIALVIANQNYDRVRNAQGAGSVLQSVRRLEEMGFRVELATDLSAPAMEAALTQLSGALGDPANERVVIVYSGHVVSAKYGTWLMGTEATAADPDSVARQGVRLQRLLDLAAQRQGGAIVAIADYGFPQVNAQGFSSGLPSSVAVPQGVSLVRGSGAGVTEFLRAIAAPGVNIGTLVRRRGSVQLEGFDPHLLTFLPADHQPVVDFELQAWESAVSTHSIEGYQAFLGEYPNGTYAEQARAELQSLQNTPERIEAALNLSRNERRAIQRDLTILGYEPRGIDGIFGSGTRAAIASWQGNNGHARTSFLNRDQIFALAQQGAQRAAELEAEARARQQAEERRDRAFWRDTGSGQDEVGLRSYLENFPDGIFSNVAQQRLDRIEADRRAAAQARDRAAWDQARQADRIPAYRQYIRDFPDGAFVEQARTRIRQLNAPEVPDPNIEAAQAAEAALRLPRFTREIIEQRLAAMGLEPGPVDGNFNNHTRRAIRRYQRASNMPVTGYLTQAIVARLLAEGVIDLLR
ncbi:peptidoglycan-binding protein [Pararhodobacter oceanensis]|uniref:peptidoglycan-binding domain-containing protein n=1 Tax=Pararhodobacter oceanensis TaxID=2172121 RepID=UPI003A8D363C